MASTKHIIDFAYTIDSTGSMKKWISQVKTDIITVVDDLQKQFPEYTLRLGCIAYRDWSDGNKRLEKLDFTENIETFRTWVGTLNAKGGGDAAEDVLGGLNATVQLTWSESSVTRILFHICDAPPHNKIYHDISSDNWPNGYDGSKGGQPDPQNYHKIVFDKLKEINIDHFCIANLRPTGLSKMINLFKEYGKEIDLDIHERELKDTPELLDAVEGAIFEAITKVDKASINSGDINNMIKSNDPWKPMQQKKKFAAYVGIDFGTDGTGFAFALPTGKLVWQQNHTKNAHIKDRTNILLDHRSPHKVIAFGLDATLIYAQQKDKKSLYFDRFKMALYDQNLIVNKPLQVSGLNPTDDDMKDIILDSPTNPTDCIDEIKHPGELDDELDDKNVSYLRAANGVEIETKIVFQRALEEISRIAMKTLRDSAEITRIMDVQWILTVPAIWSNYAKGMMIQAAEDACIKRKGVVDHLLIATEPECASIIARNSIKDLNKIGTKYILLDLGGGTADIACHKTIGNNQFEQIYAPSGGEWGSSYIDIEYEQLLDDIFGKELMDNFRQQEPNKWIDIKEKFRKSKHRYDGKANMNIDLNNSLIKYIESNHKKMDDIEDIVEEYKYKGDAEKIECDDGTLSVDKAVWNDLFCCVVEPIIDKTAEILERKEMDGCKDILLSGGLSENKYLRARITERFGSAYNIHMMPRPILAVVEGAAKMGLQPKSISKWYAPESIGLQITREYDAKIDSVDMKIYDKFSKKYIINCGFGTLVKKGSSIDPNNCIIEWFKPYKGSSKKDQKISIKLYSSNKENEHHAIGKCEGEWMKYLPKNWQNKAFPIVYWDKGSEKRLYIAHRDWPDYDREIKVKWKNPLI